MGNTSPPPSLSKVLSIEAPTPGWPEGQALVLSGSARLSSAGGKFKLTLFDHGGYRLELLGPSKRVTASDGHRAWVQTDRGPARRLVFLERDRMTLLVQAISGLWRSQTADMTRRVTEASRRRVNLEVDYPGPAPPLGLEVDRSTGDALAISSINRGRVSRWELEGWRTLAGRRLPSRIEFQGVDRAGSRLEVQTAHWRAADPDDLVRPAGAEDAQFNPGRPEVVVARRSMTGHLFVPVRLDGGQEHWFLLDTGASGIVIDDDLARSMDLDALGVVGAVGGTGRKLARLSRAQSLDVGPLRIDQPTLLTLDLDGLAVYFQTQVEGILGCDLFLRAAVALPAGDLAPEIVIRPPGGFDSEDLPWVPALANESVLTVRGRVESQPLGWFLLDTGAAWAAAVHSPWLEALDLPGPRPVTEGRTRGIVSGGKTLVVTLGRLDFAAVTVEDVPTHLALVRDGSLADRVLVGNIGLEALAPFRMVIDLAQEHMALQPLGGGGGGRSVSLSNPEGEAMGQRQ